jgi:DNA-binding transcriptional LysR family regulator
MSTAVALVQAGLGVTILPSTAVEVRSAGIKARPVEDNSFVRKLVLVRRKSAATRSIAQRFIDSVIQQSAAAAVR